jgi:hypothetical protein
MDPLVVDDERTLYSYNNGEVLVTSKHLVLGDETWRLDQISRVELVARNDHLAIYWSRASSQGVSLMLRAMLRSFGGMAVLAVATFLAPLAEGSALLWVVLAGIPGAVGLALFFAGIFTAFRAYFKHPPQLYGVLVVLRGNSGEEDEREARYRFKYRPPAEKTILATRNMIDSLSGQRQQSR